MGSQQGDALTDDSATTRCHQAGSMRAAWKKEGTIRGERDSSSITCARTAVAVEWAMLVARVGVPRAAAVRGAAAGSGCRHAPGRACDGGAWQGLPQAVMLLLLFWHAVVARPGGCAWVGAMMRPAGWHRHGPRLRVQPGACLVWALPHAAPGVLLMHAGLRHSRAGDVADKHQHVACTEAEHHQRMHQPALQQETAAVAVTLLPPTCSRIPWHVCRLLYRSALPCCKPRV